VSLVSHIPHPCQRSLLITLSSSHTTTISFQLEYWNEWCQCPCLSGRHVLLRCSPARITCASPTSVPMGTKISSLCSGECLLSRHCVLLIFSSSNATCASPQGCTHNHCYFVTAFGWVPPFLAIVFHWFSLVQIPPPPHPRATPVTTAICHHFRVSTPLSCHHALLIFSGLNPTYTSPQGPTPAVCPPPALNRWPYGPGAAKTLSTAAHHASALTLSAGLARRGERRDVSFRSAKYKKPSCPVMSTLVWPFAVSIWKTCLLYSVKFSAFQSPPIVDSTAELDQILSTLHVKVTGHCVHSPYSEQSTSSSSVLKSPRLGVTFTYGAGTLYILLYY